jgi:bifunctional non-homologous end joining protein LigD
MQRKSLRTSTEPPAVPPAEDAAKPLVGFKSPMLLLTTTALPEGPAWQYELKLDGYRALAFTRGETVHLRSRYDKDFTRRYADIVKALTGLPDNTLIDGELVALDAEGRPSFNALQNGGSTVVYYVFDLLVLAGRDVTREPLDTRRALLETQVLPRLADPIKYIPPFDVPLAVLVQSVKAQALEGVVAKRRDSAYEAGLRSGAWMKMRVNRGQDFVIAGYTRGPTTFDALIFGYFEGDRLIYAARTRSGFTPATRTQLVKRLRALEIDECPFANLPEAKSGRWGQGLTKAKMAVCQWLKPVLVGRFEFLEWTGENHLRHSKFIGLCDGREAKGVAREPE